MYKLPVYNNNNYHFSHTERLTNQSYTSSRFVKYLIFGLQMFLIFFSCFLLNFEIFWRFECLYWYFSDWFWFFILFLVFECLRMNTIAEESKMNLKVQGVWIISNPIKIFNKKRDFVFGTPCRIVNQQRRNFPLKIISFSFFLSFPWTWFV